MTKQFVVPFANLGNVKQSKSEGLRSYLNRLIANSAYVRWAPNTGILAHLTNEGVLLETPFWDEL